MSRPVHHPLVPSPQAPPMRCPPSPGSWAEGAGAGSLARLSPSPDARCYLLSPTLYPKVTWHRSRRSVSSKPSACHAHFCLDYSYRSRNWVRGPNPTSPSPKPPFEIPALPFNRQQIWTNLWNLPGISDICETGENIITNSENQMRDGVGRLWKRAS